MSKKQNQVQLVLNVLMGESDATKLAEVYKDTPEQVPALAAYLLTQYAQGGLMFKAEEMENLQRLTGGKIANSASITQLVEKALERREGGFTVQANIDPSLFEPIKETASMMGMNVNALMQDAFNTMLQNGWLYSFTPSGGQLLLTKEQREALVERFGGFPSTEQVFNALKIKVKSAAGIQTFEDAPAETPAPPPVAIEADAVPAEV